MNTTTKVVLGIAVAAAAGAAIGMLLAPEKGTDLQKKIKDTANDWLKEFNGLLNTGNDVVNQVKSKVGRDVGTMKAGLTELTDHESYPQ